MNAPNGSVAKLDFATKQLLGAANLQNLTLMREIMKNHPNVNKDGVLSSTGWAYAVIKELLDCGADPNVLNKWTGHMISNHHRTLKYAISKGFRFDCMEALLDSQPNQVHYLSIVCSRDTYRLKWLLRRGLDITLLILRGFSSINCKFALVWHMVRTCSLQ